MMGPSPQFTLFSGGPSQVLWRGERTSPEKTPQIALAAVIAWAPLVIFGLVQGIAIGPTARESVLADPALYARFLIALPLLLYAPSRIDPMLDAIVRQFVDKGLIGEGDRARFASFISAAQRAKTSRIADLLCLVGAYSSLLVLVFVYRGVLAPEIGSTWHSYVDGDERRLTLAGWWHLMVSQPLYFFVVLRFFYRLAVWWRLLFQISQLPVRLNSFDADQSAGLSFVRLYLRPLRLPAFAIAVSAAGSLADLVLWANVSVADYKFAVALFVVLVVAAFAGPLVFFAAPIRRAREAGVLLHGALVARQLEQFEAKWASGGRSARDMLTAPDFSALIDFSSAVGAAQKTRGLFEPLDLILLAISAVTPFLFVAALELPIREIVMQLVKLVS